MPAAPHRGVSLRGFERSHPQLVCVLYLTSSERWVARLVLASQAPGRSRPLTASDERQRTWAAGDGFLDNRAPPRPPAAGGRLTLNA